MKRILQSVLFFFFLQNANAQPNATIQVSGSQLIGVCGDTIVLRGLNYEPFNWGYDINDEKFAEVSLTGANCVRIPWYTSSAAAGGAPLFDQLENLDTAIARCIRNKMIAIVDLHDNTCNGDISQIATLSNWWLNPNVLSLITSYKHSIIVNIANEAGYVQWSGNAAAALVDFKNTYQGIVTNFRNAGIDVPLMIDAPDCGTDLDDLASIAPALQLSDPLHNLIFSAHTYWYAYANNDSITMRNKIINALAQNVPIVLGEIANLQDDAIPCAYSLNYKALLHICSDLNVPWLAWSWDHDNCPGRQISSNGLFSALTNYGNDIVNNTDYGLQAQSIITEYLAHNQVCATAINELNPLSDAFELSYLSNGILVKSLTDEDLRLTFYDMLSRKLSSLTIKKGESTILHFNQSHGSFFVNATSQKGSYTRMIIM
jgi:mannan endo-1,4-beta-mannosidase